MSRTLDWVLTRIWLMLAASGLLAGGLHLGAVLGARSWATEVAVAAEASRCDVGAGRPAGTRDAIVPIHRDRIDQREPRAGSPVMAGNR